VDSPQPKWQISPVLEFATSIVALVIVPKEFLTTLIAVEKVVDKGFDESLSFTDSNLWLQQWKFLGFGTQRRTSRSALMVKTKTKKKGEINYLKGN